MEGTLFSAKRNSLLEEANMKTEGPMRCQKLSAPQTPWLADCCCTVAAVLKLFKQVLPFLEHCLSPSVSRLLAISVLRETPFEDWRYFHVHC